MKAILRVRQELFSAKTLSVNESPDFASFGPSPRDCRFDLSEQVEIGE
jgi:hypothetical protein